jgi:acetyl esterase/lipase
VYGERLSDVVDPFALSSFGGAVHLTINDRLSRVVSHPAFAGFGRLIVPWDSKVYDETMRLRDIGALLPYHTHVSLRVVVSALNRLIDDATIGKAIFHEVYSTSDREADPTRKDAGLFFFRGEPGAPFALICPGGGFSYVASVHEGFPYAAEINKRGFNAFVLKYRTGRGSAVATQDLVVSLDYIVRHASRLGVSTTGYSLWGSSAGARMVATIGSHGTGSLSATGLLKPSAVVMAYTGHADVGPAEPATFAIVGERDTIASPSIMNKRIKRVRQSGAPVEFHVYPGLGHGFGLGIGTGAEGWLADAIRFWSEQIKRG